MRHETHTGLKREDVFAAAKKYFGLEDGGLGMKLSAEQGCQIAFSGVGQVWITVWPAKSKDGSVRVDLDVSGRDTEARDFIAKILR